MQRNLSSVTGVAALLVTGPPAPKFTRILGGMTLILVFLFLSVPAAQADSATYSYFGNPLECCGPPPFIAPGITGSIELPSPLPDGNSSYAATDLLSFEFTGPDGIIGGPQPPGPGNCNFADVFDFTSTAGRITDWNINAYPGFCDGKFTSDLSGDSWQLFAGTDWSNQDPGVWVSNVPDSGGSLLLTMLAVGSLIVGKKRFRRLHRPNPSACSIPIQNLQVASRPARARQQAGGARLPIRALMRDTYPVLETSLQPSD
jgi:hypothetical protein